MINGASCRAYLLWGCASSVVTTGSTLNDAMMHQNQRYCNMDVEKLIEELIKSGILEKIQHKRLTTSELPASLYIKLIIASFATKKSLSACIATAMETYTMRNEEKHLNEIRIQAAADGKSLEKYLVEIIVEKLED